MLEEEIERYLVGRVERLGGEVRKVHWLGRRGAPDRLVLLPGRAFWIELKRPGKRPGAVQENELDTLRQAGMSAFWADSRTLIDRILAQ